VRHRNEEFASVAWDTPVLLREGGMSQASLKIPDDRLEKPGREKSRAQRARRVLTDGR